jgi:ACS family pantothenate transporter-like MFS transporter
VSIWHISHPNTFLGLFFVLLDEVGYVVFQISSTLVLVKYPEVLPGRSLVIMLTWFQGSYYLPFGEISSDVFTLGTAFVITYEQLVVMRFFIGPCTTSCYLGLVHVVNSQVLIEWLSWPLANLFDRWYRKKELGRRNVVFWFPNSLGQMISKQQGTPTPTTTTTNCKGGDGC